MTEDRVYEYVRKRYSKSFRAKHTVTCNLRLCKAQILQMSVLGDKIKPVGFYSLTFTALRRRIDLGLVTPDNLRSPWKLDPLELLRKHSFNDLETSRVSQFMILYSSFFPGHSW